MTSRASYKAMNADALMLLVKAGRLFVHVLSLAFLVSLSFNYYRMAAMAAFWAIIVKVDVENMAWMAFEKKKLESREK